MRDTSGLRAGAYWKTITPPLGVELSGYGFYLNRKATEIQRPLSALALVLEQGEERVAIITADLLAVSAEMTAKTRAMVSKMTTIPEENVVVACSHTHSGPATVFIRGCGEVDSDYANLLPRYLASAVIEAEKQLEEVGVYVGKSHLEGLAQNRVDPHGAVDTEIQVVELLGHEGGNSHLLISFGCHPVHTLANDTAVSPDFMAGARDILERNYDSVHFLQGSCGDINPVNAHTNLSGQARSAQMLAGAALIAAGQATEVVNLSPLRCLRRTVELPLNIPSREALEAKRDENRRLAEERDPESPPGRYARFQVEATESLLGQLTGESDPWLEILRDAQEEVSKKTGREPRLNELATVMDLPPDAVMRLLQLQQVHGASGHLAPQTLSCELQAVRIGDIALLAHPTELFAEFGLELKANSPFPHTLIVGYANDFLGYVPNEADFARQGYAADTVPSMLDLFPFASNVGRVFTEASLQLLHALHT